MKSLETFYNGHKFRSRTEARWAVFFDAIGIKYFYEHEDVVLPSGRYLPDFYLPNFETSGAYAEVKGVATDAELAKCRQLCEHTGKPVIVLEGVPDFKCYYYYAINEEAFVECTDCFEPCKPNDKKQGCTGIFKRGAERLYGIVNANNKYGERIYVYPGFEGNDLVFKESDWYENYRDAVYYARSARFEFGESGPTIIPRKEEPIHIPPPIYAPESEGIKQTLEDLRKRVLENTENRLTDPITQDRLESAWQLLVTYFQQKRSAAMYVAKNVVVKVLDENRFEITVPTIIDLKIIESERNTIIEKLMGVLNNELLGFIVRTKE